MLASRSFQFDSEAEYTQTDEEATMNETHDAECAVAAAAELIASKWTPLLIHDLSEGPGASWRSRTAARASARGPSERLQMLEQEGVLSAAATRSRRRGWSTS